MLHAFHSGDSQLRGCRTHSACYYAQPSRNMSPLPPLSLERNLGALPTLVSFRVSVQWCAMVGALATVENWGVPKKPLSSSKRTLSQYQEKTPALVASVSSYPAKPATAGAHLDALNCHFASLVSDFLLSRAASAPHPPARFDSKRTAGCK